MDLKDQGVLPSVKVRDLLTVQKHHPRAQSSPAAVPVLPLGALLYPVLPVLLRPGLGDPITIRGVHPHILGGVNRLLAIQALHLLGDPANKSTAATKQARMVWKDLEVLSTIPQTLRLPQERANQLLSLADRNWVLTGIKSPPKSDACCVCVLCI